MRNTIFITGFACCLVCLAAIAKMSNNPRVPIPSYHLYEDGRIVPIGNSPEFEVFQKSNSPELVPATTATASVITAHETVVAKP